MATAIRMSADAVGTVMTTVIGDGRFAAELAQRLGRISAPIKSGGWGREGVAPTAPSTVVVVVGSSEVVDDMLGATMRGATASADAWLPVTLIGPIVQIGPMVGPDSTACVRCFQDRMLQHAGQADVLPDVRSARAGHSSGFLPHQCGIVASLVLAEIQRGPVDPGEVVSLHLDLAEVTSSALIPCHACPVCHPPVDGITGHLLDILERQR